MSYENILILTAMDQELKDVLKEASFKKSFVSKAELELYSNAEKA